VLSLYDEDRKKCREQVKHMLEKFSESIAEKLTLKEKQEYCITQMNKYMDMTSTLLRDREIKEETYSASCELSAKLSDALRSIFGTVINENTNLRDKINKVDTIQTEFARVT
jgi:Zn-dependent oligopeptidase